MNIDINIIVQTYNPTQTNAKSISLITQSNFRVKLDLAIIPMEEYAKKGYESLIFHDVYLKFQEPNNQEITIHIEGVDSREKTKFLGSVTGKLHKAAGKWWELLNPIYTEKLNIRP